MSRSVSVGMSINSPSMVVPSDWIASVSDSSPGTQFPRPLCIPSATKAPGGACDALGCVVRWGRATAEAHRNSPHGHPLRRVGVRTCTGAADKSLLNGISGHLRFSLEPIVEIKPVLSSAEFVKFVCSLANLVLNLLRRPGRFPVSKRSGVLFFHSGVPPFRIVSPRSYNRFL